MNHQNIVSSDLMELEYSQQSGNLITQKHKSQPSMEIEPVEKMLNGLSVTNQQELNISHKSKNFDLYQKEENINTLIHPQHTLLSSVSTAVSTSMKTSISLRQNQDNNFFEFYFCSQEETVKYSGEYVNEIYETLLEAERNFFHTPIYGYMENQTEITKEMRSILVDWLMELHFKFKFHPSSLFLTIYIIDKYLSLHIIKLSNLQLLGIAAFFIACKQEEITPPTIEQLVFVTDNAYTRQQLIQMESAILSDLDYNLLVPSAFDFFAILAKTFGFNKAQFHLGEFFMESFLVNYKYTKYPSSLIGCACAYITMKFYMIKDYQKVYDMRLNSYNFDQSTIKKMAQILCNHTEKLLSSNLCSIAKKFSSQQYDFVALNLKQV